MNKQTKALKNLLFYGFWIGVCWILMAILIFLLIEYGIYLLTFVVFCMGSSVFYIGIKSFRDGIHK